MLTAMIVDDEVLSIRMLESIIDWQRLGIEVIATAADGRQAYQLFVEKRPQIIITDIRMPGVDGLEFMKRVKELEPGVEIVLISAYADFSYVQKAIALGGANYLLKPVDELELEKTLQQICDKINSRRNTEKIVQDTRRQKSVRSLYQYMRTGSGQAAAERSALALELDLARYALMGFVLNESTMNAYTENCQQLEAQLPYLQLRLAEHLNEWGKNLLFEFEDGCWVALLLGPGWALADCAFSMTAVFERELNMEVHTCFTEPAAGLLQLPQQFDLLQKLNRYSFFIGEDSVLGYGYNCVKTDFDRLALLDLRKTLETAVTQNDDAAACKALDEGLAMVSCMSPDELHYLYEFCYGGVQTVRDKLQRENRADKLENGLARVGLADMERCATLDELRAATVQVLELIADGPARGKEYSALVEAGVRYLHANFNRNLSLDEICGTLGVSKNYFCYLFKKETGENLWAYLTQIRIRRARELLEQTTDKTYSIAYQVGYDNPSYFSKLFKKSTGEAPGDYRQTHRPGGR